MDRLLEGRTAIITGSGRGIGRATAELLAEHGARVVISDIDPAPAEETAAAIRAAGGEALSVPGDVSDRNFPDLIVQSRSWAASTSSSTTRESPGMRSFTR
jgi:3-oxoacyl-[acyl-carrier protein] reductase